ncbi:transcription factor Vhr1-domain-containing protein [Lipomyces oligophaga]|uniref:transcription factor Vhr1-domain-containing protein n=1 Tax=Lipomyces oligophaga TaxID=45792 RepID=UPI0034CF66AF
MADLFGSLLTIGQKKQSLPSPSPSTSSASSSVSSASSSSSGPTSSLLQHHKSIRIQLNGNAINWTLDDPALSFERLQAYVRAAFFIPHNQPFSICARSTLFPSSSIVARPIVDDSSFHRALIVSDVFFDINLEPASAQGLPSTVPASNPVNSSSVWSTPSSIPAFAAAASTHSSYPFSLPSVSSLPAVPSLSSKHGQSHAPHAPHASHPPHAHPISNGLPPVQVQKHSNPRVSGVTQIIRQKLQFTNEGQWKKFSARRLELIDSMSLSSRKASEQEDVIIAVADTLREEYGFPPVALPDFDKLVRAAVQSVRRNRKRLPKSKAKLVSKKESASPSPSAASTPAHSPSAAHAVPISAGSVSSVNSDLGFDSTSVKLEPIVTLPSIRTTMPSPQPWPSPSSAVSDTLVGSDYLARPALSRASSSYSSYLSVSSSANESPDPYSTSASSLSLSPLSLARASSVSSVSPRTLPSLSPVSTSLFALDLIYQDSVRTCTILPSDIAACGQSCLAFLLQAVRQTLSLSESVSIALYYYRSTTVSPESLAAVDASSKVQITSDLEAELILRVPVSDGHQMRVEVVTSTDPPAHPTQSWPKNDKTRRISIGALVSA